MAALVLKVKAGHALTVFDAPSPIQAFNVLASALPAQSYPVVANAVVKLRVYEPAAVLVTDVTLYEAVQALVPVAVPLAIHHALMALSCCCCCEGVVARTADVPACSSALAAAGTVIVGVGEPPVETANPAPLTPVNVPVPAAPQLNKCVDVEYCKTPVVQLGIEV